MLGKVSIVKLEQERERDQPSPWFSDVLVGQFHGMGTYEKNGEKYEGEWADGMRNGFGTYYNRKGSRYEGSWRNGRRRT